MTAVTDHGGTPVVFPCHGLAGLDGDGWVAAHAELAGSCDRFYAFELDAAFAPFGVVHDTHTYRKLLEVEACIGAKHSSLHRQPEWDRLQCRDRHRPDFQVLTGNDLAIDMVVYGSDYLLGLVDFAPDSFAHRDRMWAAGYAAFRELNDVLQSLGPSPSESPSPPTDTAQPCSSSYEAGSTDATPTRVCPSAPTPIAPSWPRSWDDWRGGHEIHPGEEARHPRGVHQPPRPPRNLSPARRRGRPRGRAGVVEIDVGRPERPPTDSRSCRWRAGTARRRGGPPT